VIRLRSKSVIIFANYCFDHYFKGSTIKTLHAYLPLLPAVKTNQPRYVMAFYAKELWAKLLKPCQLFIVLEK